MALAKEFRDELLGPRRFAVAMSLAVICARVLGARFKGDVDYSGFAVTLQHPERALIALWVVWGWAHLRYGQKLYELWQEIRHDLIEDVDAEDTRMAMHAAYLEAVRKARDGTIGDRHPNAKIRRDVFLEKPIKEIIAETQKMPAPAATPDFVPTAPGGRRYRVFGGAYDWRDDDKRESGAMGFNFTMDDWSPRRTRYHRAKAWIHAAIRLPAVTDHLFPVMLAVVAAMAIGWTVLGPPEAGPMLAQPQRILRPTSSPTPVDQTRKQDEQSTPTAAQPSDPSRQQ
jgi:hypothetical protein